MKRVICLFGCILVTTSTFALNNRSAVSVAGSDSNPCTPLSPCRSFTAAIAVTAPGGEIIALDSGGYGPFTVSTSMTISGAPGVHAAITATGSSLAAIEVNASSTDRVILRNLVMIGAGASYGLYVPSAGEVDFFNSLVRGFSTIGIYVTTSVPTNVVIDNDAVFDNSSDGIYLLGDFNAVNLVRATVSNSLVYNNGDGIYTDYGTRTVVTHCTIADNAEAGVFVNCTTGNSLSVDATVEGCTIAYNPFGTFVRAFAPNNDTAKLTLSQNMLSFNGTAVQVSLQGVAYSFGNNRFAANTSDGSALTAATLK